MKENAESCATCRFFIGHPGMHGVNLYGTCHFMPPSMSDTFGNAYFPKVYGNDWCGQWRATAEKEADPYATPHPVLL